MREFKSPVYNVIAVPIDKVQANDYNPNSVAPPEMELLETSIWEDGYTMPVVCFYDSENDKYIVVDGFHRYSILKTSKRIFEREKGMLPVSVIDKELSDRMASTIRHNRARGSHSIDLMSSIVSELVEMGKGDAWICKHIGMSKDELLRMKQITGLASLFKEKDFSESWGTEIKQQYTPYYEWECFKNGMWSKVDNEDELIKKAINFTSNHIIYGKYMNEVIFKWDKTMLNHLSNPMINKKAFVGHCAVCYKLKIPEYITRKAWSFLNDKQRYLANLEAQKAIEKWIRWYIKKSKNTSKNGKKDVINMTYQMKFQFN